MYKLAICLFMLLTCRESTSQRYYYKDYGDEFDIYYGPYAIVGYKEMKAPKTYKNEFADRGDRPGVCEPGEFSCGNKPYPIKETKHFECVEDFQCPNYFKCCQVSCFQHRICQPAVYDENSKIITEETLTVPIEAISKSPKTTLTTNSIDQDATTTAAMDVVRSTSKATSIVSEATREIPEFMYSSTNKPTSRYTTRTTKKSPKTKKTTSAVTLTTASTPKTPSIVTERTSEFPDLIHSSTNKPTSRYTTKTTKRSPKTKKTTSTVTSTTKRSPKTKKTTSTVTSTTASTPKTPSIVTERTSEFPDFIYSSTNKPTSRYTTKTTKRSPKTKKTTSTVTSTTKRSPKTKKTTSTVTSTTASTPKTPSIVTERTSEFPDFIYSSTDKPTSRYTTRTTKRSPKTKRTISTVTPTIISTAKTFSVDTERTRDIPDFIHSSTAKPPLKYTTRTTKMSPKPLPTTSTSRTDQKTTSSSYTTYRSSNMPSTDEDLPPEGSGNRPGLEDDEDFGGSGEGSADGDDYYFLLDGLTSTQRTDKTSSKDKSSRATDPTEFKTTTKPDKDEVGKETTKVKRITGSSKEFSTETVPTKFQETTKIPTTPAQTILITDDEDYVEGSGVEYFSTTRDSVETSKSTKITSEKHLTDQVSKSSTPKNLRTTLASKSTTKTITITDDEDYTEGSSEDDFNTLTELFSAVTSDKTSNTGFQYNEESAGTKFKETTEFDITKLPILHTTKKEYSDSTDGSTKKVPSTMEDDEDYTDGSGEGGHSLPDEISTDTSDIFISYQASELNKITETSTKKDFTTSIDEIRTTKKRSVTRTEDDEDYTEASGDIYVESSATTYVSDKFTKNELENDNLNKITEASTRKDTVTNDKTETTNMVKENEELLETSSDKYNFSEDMSFTFTSDDYSGGSIVTSLNQVSESEKGKIIESSTKTASSSEDKTKTTDVLENEDFTEENNDGKDYSFSEDLFATDDDKEINATDSKQPSKLSTIISSTKIPQISLVTTQITFTSDNINSGSPKETSQAATKNSDKLTEESLSTDIPDNNYAKETTKSLNEASKSATNLSEQSKIVTEITSLDPHFVTSSGKESPHTTTIHNKENANSYDYTSTEKIESNTLHEKVLEIALWPLNLNLTKQDNSDKKENSKEDNPKKTFENDQDVFFNDTDIDSSEKPVTAACHIEGTLIPKLRKKTTTVSSDTDKSNESDKTFSKSDKSPLEEKSKPSSKKDKSEEGSKQISNNEADKDKSVDGKSDEASKQSVKKDEPESGDKSDKNAINEHNESLKNVTETNKNKYSDDEDDKVEGSGDYYGSGGHEGEKILF